MAGMSALKMADVAGNEAPPRYFRVRFAAAMFTSSYSKTAQHDSMIIRHSDPFVTTCLLIGLAARATAGHGSDAAPWPGPAGAQHERQFLFASTGPGNRSGIHQSGGKGAATGSKPCRQHLRSRRWLPALRRSVRCNRFNTGSRSSIQKPSAP